MKITIAKAALCFGIEHTYKRLNNAASSDKQVSVIHRWGANPKALFWDPIHRLKHQRDEDLHKCYPHLEKVRVLDSMSELREGLRLAVGHHGISRDERAAAEAHGAEILDFKCPMVAKFDKTVEDLVADGHDIIAFGKTGNHHCEYARHVAENAGRIGLICENADDIRNELVNPARRWACVGQVTAHISRWAAFCEALSQSGVDVKIADTVCKDSYDRQNEAVTLAQNADVVLVINDHGGSTVSVFEQCSSVNPDTRYVDPDEPLPDLEATDSVAIVCGIHVPSWILQDYADRLARAHP